MRSERDLERTCGVALGLGANKLEPGLKTLLDASPPLADVLDHPVYFMPSEASLDAVEMAPAMSR